ncbi:MAG: SDR family NAD(P)-dependent oxidoreductase [Lachnospiraceae bacterium]
MSINKQIFISGASRGIGKAIAELFASQGYDLHLTCQHNIDVLQREAKKLEETYATRISCYQIDMSDSHTLAQFMKTLPPLDVVINNVGISHIGLLTDLSIEEWNLILQTNLTSSFVVCRNVLPSMIGRQAGKIINISSVWGLQGASMEVCYSTTKGALNSFTKALAKEMAPSNIQINAIACGLINTDMNRCFSEEELLDVIDQIPANRIGEAFEVADLCLQLVNAPTYLTGQIISLDGGWI